MTASWSRLPPSRPPTKKFEPGERSDDPVRMYLREMGSLEILSREGEVAIAKRIEAGRDAMVSSLCESPLTFQAIIIWRGELNDGKVFLRDIIDLEATYAGAETKAMVAPAGDGAATPAGAVAAVMPVGAMPPQTQAPVRVRGAPPGPRPASPCDRQCRTNLAY